MKVSEKADTLISLFNAAVEQLTLTPSDSMFNLFSTRRKELENYIAKLEKAWRGIPVSKKLPEDHTTVLVAFTSYPEHVSFSVATYHKHYKGFGGVDNYWEIEDYHWGDPTYWWPLPELEEVEQ